MSDMEELSTTTESAPTEAPAPSTNPPDTTASDASADEASSTTAPESDDEEAEINGEKYRIPKTLSAHLKDLEQGRLRQEDYTRKTQTVAEERKELESRQQQLVAREQFQQQHVQAVAEVISIDKQLANYQALDWNGLMDANPVQAMKLDRQMRELQTQRTQIVSGIDQEQQKQTQAQHQSAARQRQEAMEMLSRDIKGFGTPEVTKALMDVGKELGYKPEELTNVTDPRAIKLLHEAHLYRKLVAKQLSEAKPKPAEVKPITRVTPGSGAVKKSISDPGISMADFVKLRHEQTRRK
ncbi:MAG: hypothetical protein V4563_15950 [Pseudomonadota bacterium]